MDHVQLRLSHDVDGEMMRTYLKLTKPGIIFGNCLTAAAGFFLASKGSVDISLLGAMLGGLACIVASACVFNNYIDREADQKMVRTQKRALPRGEISPKQALIFGAILCALGFLTLILGTNLVAAATALAGFLIYIFFYSYLKYQTPYATWVGSVAGAMPPVVGYTAVAHRCDLAALILFMIVFLWQMPHFFAIGIYRLHDYAKAGIPILPVKSGIPATKVQMVLCVIAFMMTAPLLTVLGYTGYAYLTASLLLSAAWLYIALQGFRAKNAIKWARSMFFYSLGVIMVLSLLISFRG
jgi:protoheme IX farnesyltransferase